jgi:hypothetical protein
VALAYAAALLLGASSRADAADAEPAAGGAGKPDLAPAPKVTAVPRTAAAPAAPPTDPDPNREAARRYQRGVDLYDDGDYRGALVEFKQAYATGARVGVLYDIGRTEVQLGDHAAALRTFGRYLAEAGADAGHRAEVEAGIARLRTRVGRIAVSVDAAARCELTVDDEPAGTTPMETPLVVTAGPRKVAVNCANQGVTASRVEVAAGETVRVELHPPPPPIAAVRAAMAASAGDGSAPAPTTRPFMMAWTATGLLLMGTAAVGTAALVEQGRLNALRSTYPVTERQLDRQSSLVSGLSLSTDIIGAATAATAAIASWLTVKYHRERRVHGPVHARGMSLGGTF